MVRALTIAGSDSGGGAGIQADLKTFMAYGVYGMSAVTVVTAQNSQGVHAIDLVSPQTVYRQIVATVEDYGVDAIKIGMLYTEEMIDAVAAALERIAAVPVVWDPVMRAKDGTALLTDRAVGRLTAAMRQFATVVTPNLPEAETLAGLPIASAAAMADVARLLRQSGLHAVLLKGGHLPGDEASDFLCGEQGEQWFSHIKLVSQHTHGTGCTLSSAIAAGLARGFSLPQAVGEAKRYVTEAIRHAPRLGRGSGPMHHGWGGAPWI